MANRLLQRYRPDRRSEKEAVGRATSREIRSRSADLLERLLEDKPSNVQQQATELRDRIRERDVLRTASIPGFAPPGLSNSPSASPGGVSFVQPTRTGNGQINPVPGATLSNSFGAPRSGGRTHQGIDIFAEKGTPVVAPIKGTVRKIGTDPNSLGGNTVSITDENGNNFYFAHLNTISPLQVGQSISPGTVLGTVGNTGNARTTPPHLHFSINEGRQNVINAYSWLTGG